MLPDSRLTANLDLDTLVDYVCLHHFLLLDRAGVRAYAISQRGATWFSEVMARKERDRRAGRPESFDDTAPPNLDVYSLLDIRDLAHAEARNYLAEKGVWVHPAGLSDEGVALVWAEILAEARAGAW